MVVDATQTLGAMPFPMEQVKPDFLIAAGYKWLLSPYGCGLLYVAPQWRDARPLEETWLARENASDFASLMAYSDTYMPGARRYDVGEKCVPTILPGAIAALMQIKIWGILSITDTLSAINQRISTHLVELGFELGDGNQRCPHLFGTSVHSKYKGNLVEELKAHKIYVSQRGSSVRFAPHLHVNEYDITRLSEGINELINK